MIQDYYGLTTNAFSLSPDLDFVFVSKAHEETLAHLAYGLEQNEDITLIVGDIGTGKTLALHRLLSQVSKSFVPVYITVTHMEFEQLMQLILLKLDVAIPAGEGLAGLLHCFENYLITHRERGQKVLLVIDEAQNLPIKTLESVRMIMNLAQPGKSVLQLILVGQLDLGQKLDLHEMRQLRQRIRVEYKLSLLSRKELEAYIIHRLEVAGRTDSLFKKSAFDKIYKYSNGVPRLVNHLVTSALVNGFVAEAKMISGRHIEKLQGVISEESVFTDLDSLSLNQEPDPIPTSPKEEVPLSSSQPKSRSGLWAFAAVIIIAVVGYATQSYWRPFLVDSAVNSEVDTPYIQSADLITLKDEPSDVGSVNDALDSAPTDSSEDVVEIVIPQIDAPIDSMFIGHFASFRDESLATQCREGITSPSVEVFVKLVDIGDGDLWYRVYLGPFDTQELAQEACSIQRDLGVIQYFSITEEASTDSL